MKGILMICVVCVIVSVGGMAWALDEAVLTPTPKSEMAMSKKDKAKAEKEFNAAMSVWFGHDYKNGEKLLGEFARVW